MEEKDRIEQIIEHVKLNAAQFAAEIDITAPALSHILNGRNNPSLDVMKKILEHYPSISSDWLILGKGPMFNEILNSTSPSLFDNFDITNERTDDYISKEKEEKASSKLDKEKKIAKERNDDGPIMQQQQVTISTTKKIERIIIYFDDNTFQEFQSVE